MFGIIYKVTNLKNGCVYIGQTKKSLAFRKNRHKHGNRSRRLGEAFDEFGFDNFKWEQIEECANQIELDKAECKWIEFYKSTDKNFGYNIIPGGLSNGIIADETLEILRKKSSDYIRKNPINFTDEIRQKQSEGQKRYYKNNPEARKKISEHNIEKYKDRKVSIKQARSWNNFGFFALKDGVSYGMFYTYKEAANFIGSSISGIQKVLKGTRKNIYGYTLHTLEEKNG